MSFYFIWILSTIAKFLNSEFYLNLHIKFNLETVLCELVESFIFIPIKRSHDRPLYLCCNFSYSSYDYKSSDLNYLWDILMIFFFSIFLISVLRPFYEDKFILFHFNLIFKFCHFHKYLNKKINLALHHRRYIKIIYIKLFDVSGTLGTSSQLTLHFRTPSFTLMPRMK